MTDEHKDEQLEPSIFDALRDGSLKKYLFDKSAQPVEGDKTSQELLIREQGDDQPEELAPVPDVSVVKQVGTVRTAPVQLLRQLGMWAMVIVVVIFATGFILGVRWASRNVVTSDGSMNVPLLPAGPVREPLNFMGQTVIVTYSALDIGSMPDAFDGKFETLLRGAGDNPFIIKIEFPEPVSLSAMDLTIGTLFFCGVNVTLTYDDGSQQQLENTYQDMPFDPTVTVEFPMTDLKVQQVLVSIEDIRPEPTEGYHIHVRELVLR